MFVVEVFELSWPVLGAMLALWAHLGGSLGPGRGLCWPILGPMLAYFGPKNGSKRRWPKNTQKMTQKRSRQRPARAARRAQKRTIFGTLKTSVVDIPTCIKNASTKAYKTRFMLPPARNRVFWAHLGLCWPVLGATLAHLGGSVDAILGHVVENVENAKSTVNHSISGGSAAPGRGRVLLRGRRCLRQGHVQGPWPDFMG